MARFNLEGRSEVVSFVLQQTFSLLAWNLSGVVLHGTTRLASSLSGAVRQHSFPCPGIASDRTLSHACPASFSSEASIASTFPFCPADVKYSVWGKYAEDQEDRQLELQYVLLNA